MAAVEAGFEESFSGFKWYQFGECLCQKEVMKNTVVLKKDGNFYLLWQVIYFLLLTFVFDTRHGSTESFIFYLGCFAFKSEIRPPSEKICKSDV